MTFYKLNYFFQIYGLFFGGIKLYLFRNWFLNTDNKFAKVSILFTVFINLDSHTLQSSTELFRAIKLSAALLDKYFKGHIVRFFLKLATLKLEWVNWNRFKRLYRRLKPEFRLLHI